MAQNRIIRLHEVIRRVGLSRSSIYQYIQKGMFPKQIPIGARAVGWLEAEIDLWIDGQRAGGAL
jgi:prophage regulatory protein